MAKFIGLLCYLIMKFSIVALGLYLSAPSITDWLQAAGSVIGIPGAIAAFVFLFLRDKDKEKQIDALVSLANKQDDIINQLRLQLNEFAQQTLELQSQTQIASIGNVLLSDQIKILTDHFDFTKELSLSRTEQETKDRKRELRPNFVTAGASEGGHYARYQVELENVGNQANEIQLHQQSPHIITQVSSNNRSNSTTANNKEVLNVLINYVTSMPSPTNERDFFFSIIYKDSDSTKYMQTILHQNHYFKITEPVPAD